MKTARPPKGYSPGTLADPAFTYRPSHSTNVAATIARARRALAKAAEGTAQPDLFAAIRAKVPA